MLQIHGEVYSLYGGINVTMIKNGQFDFFLLNKSIHVYYCLQSLVSAVSDCDSCTIIYYHHFTTSSENVSCFLLEKANYTRHSSQVGFPFHHDHTLGSLSSKVTFRQCKASFDAIQFLLQHRQSGIGVVLFLVPSYTLKNNDKEDI